MTNQRLYAAVGIAAMLLQLAGEVVGTWQPKIGFAITILSSLGFLGADAILLWRHEPAK